MILTSPAGLEFPDQSIEHPTNDLALRGDLRAHRRINAVKIRRESPAPPSAWEALAKTCKRDLMNQTALLLTLCVLMGSSCSRDGKALNSNEFQSLMDVVEWAKAGSSKLITLSKDSRGDFSSTDNRLIIEFRDEDEGDAVTTSNKGPGEDGLYSVFFFEKSQKTPSVVVKVKISNVNSEVLRSEIIEERKLPADP